MLKSLNSLHHAYLLIGSKNEAQALVHDFFESQAVRLIGSPDFFLYSESLFGIEEARKVTDTAIRKAFTERKVFLIVPERITFEAQNALLKTFEEPIAHTHFFLVVRDEHIILPTLRSRMHTLRVHGEEEASEAEAFLALPLGKRLDFAKKFADNEKHLSAFLDQLLVLLRRRQVFASLASVYQARLVSDNRAAAPRLILEHLAFML